MRHITSNGNFGTAEQAIKDVKQNQLPVLNPIGERKPVVVQTKISARKITYGIQFWTDEMIADGQSANTDKTISFICK